MNYKAHYYLKQNGRSPFEKFVNSLCDPMAKLLVNKFIERLVDNKCQLPSHLLKHIDKKIYELRIYYNSDKYRVFYFVAGRGSVVLLDGYVKKSHKIPKHILSRVKNYYLDYMKYGYKKVHK